MIFLKAISSEWFLFKVERTEILNYTNSNLEMRIPLFNKLETRKKYSHLEVG